MNATCPVVIAETVEVMRTAMGVFAALPYAILGAPGEFSVIVAGTEGSCCIRGCYFRGGCLKLEIRDRDPQS